MRRVVLASALSLALAACSLLVSTDDLTGGPTDAGALAEGSADAPSEATPPAPPPPPASVDAGDGGSPTYREAVLADSPLSYWRLGETSGTQAKDETGAHDGAYAGTLMLGAPGAILSDSDLAITMTDGEVDFGAIYDFDGRASYSIEVWVMPTTIDSVYRNIYTKLTSEPRTGHFGWVQQEGLTFERNLAWTSDGGGVQESVGQPNGAPLNVWTHVVMTYDGMQEHLYLNGVHVSDGNSDLSLTATTEHFYIGSNHDVGAPFVGSIDEFAVYGAVLPADRIAAHFAASGR